MAAGTRRIEAVAGDACIDWYRNEYSYLPTVLASLRANSSADLGAKVDKLATALKDTQRQLALYSEKLAQADTGMPTLSATYQGKDRKTSPCYQRKE